MTESNDSGRTHAGSPEQPSARHAMAATRSSLISRLKDWGDQASWQEFFDTYWRLIYAMAVQAGLSDAEAQDVVQETVITVAKKVSGFRTGHAFGSFKAWLLKITRHRIGDQFRKRQRLTAGGRQDPDDGTATTSTLARIPDPASLDWDALWEEQWKQNLFEAAVERVKARVDPKQYLLFHQQTVREWTAATVAKKYGVNLAQAYMAKYRVSRAIKAEVKKLESRFR